MSALLNRAEFREFLQAHANDRFIRGCTTACPLARYLTKRRLSALSPEDRKDRKLEYSSALFSAQVFSDHYHLPEIEGSYSLPIWARNFVLRFDQFQGEGLALTGARALALLGPEDEDDDEHPGRAMLDEHPPKGDADPDESPDYDDELEDSEPNPDYEEDDE